MSIIKKENVRSEIVEKSNTSTRMARSQQRKRDWGFKKKKKKSYTQSGTEPSAKGFEGGSLVHQSHFSIPFPVFFYDLRK